MSTLRKAVRKPCKAFRPGLWKYNPLKFKKFWWDGWPPDSQAKCLFCQEFDFPGSVDAPFSALSKNWLPRDVVGHQAQSARVSSASACRNGA
jgi:hypothetical protein